MLTNFLEENEIRLKSMSVKDIRGIGFLYSAMVLYQLDFFLKKFLQKKEKNWLKGMIWDEKKYWVLRTQQSFMKIKKFCPVKKYEIKTNNHSVLLWCLVHIKKYYLRYCNTILADFLNSSFQLWNINTSRVLRNIAGLLLTSIICVFKIIISICMSSPAQMRPHVTGNPHMSCNWIWQAILKMCIWSW